MRPRQRRVCYALASQIFRMHACCPERFSCYPGLVPPSVSRSLLHSRLLNLTPYLSPALVGLVLTFRVRVVPLVEKSMDSDYLGSATPMWCPTPPPPPPVAVAHQPSEHSGISITHSMEMGFFNMPYHEAIIPTAWNPFAGPRNSRSANAVVPAVVSTPVTPVSLGGARVSRFVEGV